MPGFTFELTSPVLGTLTIPPDDEPMGWEDFEYMLRRDDNFHGIFPEVSSVLKFISTGRTFLKTCYDAFGIDADVYLRVYFGCAPLAEGLFTVGKLDFSSIQFTHLTAECDIISANCVDLFLKRVDAPMNLHDDPCYSELTYDKTHLRTRYVFCPYRVKFKEKTILGITSQNPVAPTGTNKDYKLLMALHDDNTFVGQVNGAWCCWFMPDSLCVSDDLQAYNYGYGEPTIAAKISNGTGCGPSTVFANNQYIMKFSCPGTYTLRINVCYDISDSYIEWSCANVLSSNAKQLVSMKWKAGAGPPLTVPGSTISMIDTIATVGGTRTTWTGAPDPTNYCISYTTPFTITPADIAGNTNFLQVYLVCEQSGVLNVSGMPCTEADMAIYFDAKINPGAVISVESLDCLPEFPSVPDSNAYCYAVHESLSRLVEFYTNNCIRVKSDYFSRPNSMLGGDDVVFNTPDPCDNNPSNLPPAVFDTTGFQGNGCGGWTIITSGINIREFGARLFTTFNELFNALDSVFNIGVGYSDLEPGVIRVETKEYFYKNSVVLNITDLDLHNSKFTRKVYNDLYFNRFVTGYEESLKDKINTIDEFNTNREYTLPLSNADTALEKRCAYVGSGYAIEYQRRQRYSVDSEFDDKNFIVCVGRNTDPNDPLSMYFVEQGVDNPQTDPINTLNFNPNGFIDPLTVINWRISPYFNTIRWLNWLKIPLWKKTSPIISFSRGETNYGCGGNEPGLDVGCDVGYDYTDLIEKDHFESDDIDVNTIDFPRAEQVICPELVEFEYALPLNEFNAIRVNPYGMIVVNNERFFIKELNFKINGISKFTLIKAF